VEAGVGAAAHQSGGNLRQVVAGGEQVRCGFGRPTHIRVLFRVVVVRQLGYLHGRLVGVRHCGFVLMKLKGHEKNNPLSEKEAMEVQQ